MNDMENDFDRKIIQEYYCITFGHNKVLKNHRIKTLVNLYNLTQDKDKLLSFSSTMVNYGGVYWFARSRAVIIKLPSMESQALYIQIISSIAYIFLKVITTVSSTPVCLIHLKEFLSQPYYNIYHLEFKRVSMPLCIQGMSERVGIPGDCMGM